MKELRVEITEREERVLKNIADYLSTLATNDSGFETKISADAIFRRFVSDLTSESGSEEKLLLVRWLELIYCKIAV